MLIYVIFNITIIYNIIIYNNNNIFNYDIKKYKITLFYKYFINIYYF